MDQDQALSSENTLSSTPPPAVFSDDAKQPSSPPSSPPGFPWDYDNAPKVIPQPPQKSAFSVLGKRKALESISDNAQPRKKQASTATKAEGGALTQMQISLGQKVQNRCKTCGMEYVVSSTEDRKMHDKYHKQVTEGYDVGRNFMKAAREGTIFEGAKKGDAVHLVDNNDKLGRRLKAQAIFDVVQRELGAAEIEGGIWDYDKRFVGEAKYRSFLYLRGTKCVGYLLAERIEEAREVIAPDRPTSSRRRNGPGSTEKKTNNAIKALQERRKTAAEELRQAESSPLELSTTPTRASLGISRIWTSSSHRRQNIASALLDAALRHHLHHIHVDSEAAKGDSKDFAGPGGKELVAFSQPTDSGARLARRWFGRVYGWKVYVD